MLIIEGTDCVGKTTFAKKLADHTGRVYQHLGPLPEGWCDEDYVMLGSSNTVRDRFHLSELAYSLVLQREVKIKNPRVLHSTLMLKHYAYTVVITARPELLQQRYVAEVELFDLSTVLEVNDIFSKMATYTDYKIVCTEDKPYPTDRDMDAICKAYYERVKFICAWRDTLKSLA